MNTPTQFRFSIDRGGTFTDIYAEVPRLNNQPARVITLKLLSKNPNSYADAPREGIRRILEQSTGIAHPAAGFSGKQIEWIRMGTTIGTNALLERQGAPTLLAISEGFEDALTIGYQNRKHIFDLKILRQAPLFAEVVGIRERVTLLQENVDQAVGAESVVVGTTGEKMWIRQPLDLNHAQKALQAAYQKGFRSIAIVLLHAYAWANHEQALGKLAAQIGFTQISLSHQVMPSVKLISRGDTTCVDAYLNPSIKAYLAGFRQGFTDQLAHTKVWFMQSHGGLSDADHFNGSHTILSGPAGGVNGYARALYDSALNQPLIGFDMGGTSTDVSRYDGAFEVIGETETAGVRIHAPQLHIATVAAGGGSRLFFKNSLFQVGPESAGADPGPCCYGKHGLLALTDANMVLGRLPPQHLPHIFGPQHNQPLSLALSTNALQAITAAVNASFQEDASQQGSFQAHASSLNNAHYSLEKVALGFIRTANEHMARTIREISVMRGYDLGTHALAAFGGAGGQHAIGLAKLLGMRAVLFHRYGGLLSAYGMALADMVQERQMATASQPANKTTMHALQASFNALEQQAAHALIEQGLPAEQIQIERYANLRFQGALLAIMIKLPNLAAGDSLPDCRFLFRQRHQAEYGFVSEAEVVIDDIRIRASGRMGSLERRRYPLVSTAAQSVGQTQTCFEDSNWLATAIYRWEDLQPGHTLQGPALLLQDGSVIVIEPDCIANMTAYGDLHIQIPPQPTLDHAAVNNTAHDAIHGAPYEAALAATPAIAPAITPPSTHHNASQTTTADPIQLSVFNNRFMSIAEQMGYTLQRIAVSTNIKERLDFSCAVFDAEGGLVANAPHIPVHLGAMGEAVKAQLRLHGNTLEKGDVLVCNDPRMGGSHLPDITVITPLIEGGKPVLFVANRGHHAEVGGITPGSIPPFSKELREEGVCISSFKLVKGGIFNEEALRNLFTATSLYDPHLQETISQWPTRRWEDNLYDLRAQAAANQKGIERLLDLMQHEGRATVLDYMSHIQQNAEHIVRNLAKKLTNAAGTNHLQLSATQQMDGGTPIAVTIAIDGSAGTFHFDFTGSGPQVWGNHNTPPAVVSSVVIYVLRTLIDEAIPINGGFLRPVTITLPAGSILSPSPQAAVVAGNVETSSRITDVLLEAFGAVAGAQGTMNNLTFGDDTFGYYETIGGGSGAGPSWHGQDAVHAHMSNTRITDVELLERRYPVVIKRFAIKKGSGGQGRFSGGNGAIRVIEFRKAMRVAIVSERRVFPPYGLEGGASGSCGKNLLLRQSGEVLSLGSCNEIWVERGDQMYIETPGGGGYGTALA